MPDPDGWRNVYSLRDELSPFYFRRAILEEYVTGLKRLGYLHIPAPRLIPRPGGQGLYFMVFATDHEAGLKIMADAFNRVESTARQGSFLPYDQRY